MTNPGKGWFQLTQTYNDKAGMNIIKVDIMFLNIYTGWKEMNMTTDLEFLVLNFKILHKFE